MNILLFKDWQMGTREQIRKSKAQKKKEIQSMNYGPSVEIESEEVRWEPDVMTTEMGNQVP